MSKIKELEYGLAIATQLIQRMREGEKPEDIVLWEEGTPWFNETMKGLPSFEDFEITLKPKEPKWNRAYLPRDRDNVKELLGKDLIWNDDEKQVFLLVSIAYETVTLFCWRSKELLAVNTFDFICRNNVKIKETGKRPGIYI